jgi:glucose/arabinose dehydrogenase
MGEMKLMRKSLLIVLVLLVSVTMISAQGDFPPSPPDGSKYTLAEVAGGFRRPVYVTGPNDGTNRLFIVEQYGKIYILESNLQLRDTLFLDVGGLLSVEGNEQGLLGLAFHPQYAENGLFFINYTDVNGDTAVVRYRVSDGDPNVADPNSGEFIIRINQPYPNHNGGGILFGPDGYLYIGMGDGGSAGDPQGNGQNPRALLGKMLRLDVDNGSPYAIPPDNPFINDSSFAPEIWAWGLRNPWRFSFDQATGDLYIGDVGQNAWEEVSFQPADSQGGENYGWNILEGAHQYSGAVVPDGLVNPFFEYNRSGGCAVTGGYVYRGRDLLELQGVYLFGDYCSGTIWASYREADNNWTTSLFMNTGMNISSFGEDDFGELYVVNHSGSVNKLVYSGG